MDLSPLLLSLEVALLATALASVLGIGVGAALRRRRSWTSDLIDAITAAPLVLPPTVLGYYLLLLLGRRSPLGQAYEAATGQSLVFTFAGAVVAATVGALPLVIRSARAALESVDPSFVAAARTLGASPLKALLLIELPLARRGLTAGVILGFARALGDFGITLVVAGNLPGETQTAPLAIYDAIQAGRDQDAQGLALILTAVAVVVLIGVQRLSGRRP